MPNLLIYSIPKDLYLQLQRLVAIKNRSISAQVVTMLTQALEEESHKTQAEALTAMRHRRFVVSKETPSSLSLLHEDRDR